MLFFGKNGVEYLIVGLGNPGDKYTNTRHNVGFCAIDYIAQKENIRLSKAKFKGLYGTWDYNGKKVALIKPQTFMNLSGDCVGEMARYYKVPSEKVLIIYDDISLDVGKMRIRRKGSAGGHNGIKSIIAHIGDEFPRIKIGAGKKPDSVADLVDWVLSDFSKEEKQILLTQYENAYNSVKLILDDNIRNAMNLYNS